VKFPLMFLQGAVGSNTCCG